LPGDFVAHHNKTYTLFSFYTEEVTSPSIRTPEEGNRAGPPDPIESSIGDRGQMARNSYEQHDLFHRMAGTAGDLKTQLDVGSTLSKGNTSLERAGPTVKPYPFGCLNRIGFAMCDLPIRFFSQS
jgi:hypothetical protein